MTIKKYFIKNEIKYKSGVSSPCYHKYRSATHPRNINKLNTPTKIMKVRTSDLLLQYYVRITYIGR